MNANLAVGFRVGVRELDGDALGATTLGVLDDRAPLGARSGLLADLPILVAIVKFNISVLGGRDVHRVNGHPLLTSAARELWAGIHVFAGGTRGTFPTLGGST